MRTTLAPRTRRRLDIQGFDTVDEHVLARVAPWLRLAFGLCALLGGVGTALTSPTILLVLTPFAALAAASPVHPFDLIYNYGIRHFTGTGSLPRRGAPSRFGCGMGAILLLVTAWAFSAGHAGVGYALGGVVTLAALLVGTTDICIPSMIYRSFFRLAARPRMRNSKYDRLDPADVMTMSQRVSAATPPAAVVSLATRMLREAFEGPPGPWTYFSDTSPGTGVLGTIGDLNAAQASQKAGPNNTTIAGHVHHLSVALALSRQALRGDSTTRDRGLSWTLYTVDDAAWFASRTKLTVR